MHIKKTLCLVLCLATLVSLLGCSTQEQTEVPDSAPTETAIIPTESHRNWTVTDGKFEATAIQSQEARYVPIQQVGTYNREIITDDMIANVNLPEAGDGKAPVWHGYILENKIWHNFENTAWLDYSAGERYFNRFEIEHMAELGFNCVRVLYGLSYLSNPEDVDSINVSELEQLDELLSWCLQNNLHLMLSITGMPGKANTSIQEEAVDKNPEIFLNPEMERTYTAYMEMLAMRYGDIPTSALSFELLAEPMDIDPSNDDNTEDMAVYEAVLTKVAQAMWKHNSHRLLIAMDMAKEVPEKLAQLGCALSLHTHVYSVNAKNLMDAYGIFMPKTYWPMPFVPANLYDGQRIHLYSQEGFAGTTVSLTYHYFNYEPELYADGVLIPWENATGQHLVYDTGELHAQIPNGTRELEVVVREELGLSTIDVSRGTSTAKLVSLYINGDKIDFDIAYTITPEGDPVAANDQTAQFGNWEYMYDSSISHFVECAEENGVSFIMTEVGTDTQSLSVEDYIAYHSEWLEVLQAHNIGWMYNCIHNILAPSAIMWQGRGLGFTVTSIKGTPYFENREITDMLVSFAQNHP